MKTTLNKNLHSFLCLIIFAIFYQNCFLYSKIQNFIKTESLLIDNIDFRSKGHVDDLNCRDIGCGIDINRGLIYGQKFINQSICLLYNTGLYDSVESRLQKTKKNHARLSFTLIAKFQVHSIEFYGNRVIDCAYLSGRVKTNIGDMVNELHVQGDLDSISDFYRSKGYPGIKIYYNIEKKLNSNSARIVFIIYENHNLNIKNVLFFGNFHMNEEVLKSQINNSSQYRKLEHHFGSKQFQYSIIRNDLSKICSLYKEKGFLDIEAINLNNVMSYKSSNEMDIIINIKEGRRYYVNSIVIIGNRVFNILTLKKQLKLYPGSIFCFNSINDDMGNILDYYGNFGYVNTQVNVERIFTRKPGAIDVIYNLKEGIKYYLELIKINGNLKTRRKVILRWININPGDFFNLSKIKSSKQHLSNTGFFNRIDCVPEYTIIPGRCILNINLEEAGTGKFSFGFGLNNLKRGLLFAEISQMNFDVFNKKTNFQGSGQILRIKLQFNFFTNEINIYFEEPSVLHRSISFGLEIYFTHNTLNTRQNNITYGANFSLSKNLFASIRSTAYLGFKSTSVFTSHENSLSFFENRKIHTIISKIGIKILRDNRNNFSNTVKNSRQEFIGEILNDFVRLEFCLSNWWPVFDYKNQALNITGRSGFLIPFGRPTIPNVGLYRLGGSKDLRGFQYNEVGHLTKIMKELEGEQFSHGTVEYSIEVFNYARFIAFYDIGFISKSLISWNCKNYNDNIGLGLKLIIMKNTPMNINLGWPLNANKFNNQGLKINCSFGDIL